MNPNNTPKFDLVSAPDDEWQAIKTSIFYMHQGTGDNVYRFQFDYFTRERPNKAELNAFLQDAAVKTQQEIYKLRQQDAINEKMERVREKHYN